MRKLKVLGYLALLLQIVTWVPVTSRVLAPNGDPSSQQIGNVTAFHSSQASYISKQDLRENSETTSETSYGRGMNKLGSRPPNCDHKCDGCIPCIAIQVPTIAGHLGIQYANYEPESWKCKCGPSFYSP